MKKILVIAIVACFFLFTNIMFVTAKQQTKNLTENKTVALNEIEETIGGVTLLIQKIGGTIGVLVLTAGGVMFMTAGENPEKKEQAKQVLTMAVIGLVIILVAPSVVKFIIG